MATTKNTYTGNNSTTNYAFTFPYIKQADIKVSLDNVVKTLTSDYTFANATTVSFNSAPATDVAIAIYRATDDSNLVATFYPGSAIRSSDLNDNYTQNLYSTQENTNDATDALSNSRVLESGAYVSAITKATTALSTSNTASTNASAAVTTANTASASATTAVNTANSASTSAGNAVTTANAATTTANAATTTANAATTTANTANTNATAAVSTANTASTNASAAVTTANTASTNASAAVTTANTASTNASNAVTTANSAAADVAAAVLFTTVANKAALEALTPTENAYYQTTDSTGLANGTFTNGGVTYTVSSIPGTYPNTQLSGITTKFSYTHSSKTYAYTSYFANDGDDRYMVGPASDGSNGQYLQTNGSGVKSWATVDLASKAPLASPTFTGTVAIPNIANVETAITGKQAADADLTALSSCQTGAATALALLTSTEVAILDDATVTTAELNILDGVTSTAAELNILDGVTSTAAELNILDGVTSTATELNLLDGKTAVGDALLASDQNWTGAQRGAVTALSSSSNSTAVDFNSSNNFSLTLGENSTLAQPSNQVVGQSGSIFVTQDGTGSRTLAYHADYKWVGGTAPTLTTTAAAVDRIDYVVAAANKVHAVASLDVK